MTQENDVKRPIQELEHDPIQKIETQPHDAPEKNEKANQALHSVTTLMQKIQRQPMVTTSFARPNVLTIDWVISLARLSPTFRFCR